MLGLTLSDYGNISSILSFLVACIATGMAFYIYRKWKEQQEYSIKINSLLDFGDKHVILMDRLFRDFSFFSNAHIAAKEARGKDASYRKEIDDKIKKQSEGVLGGNPYGKVFFEYQLSYLRLKRVLADIDDMNGFEWLNPSKIDDFQKDFISRSAVEGIQKEFSEKFIEIKENGKESISSLEKKIKC
ncbi:hypothetical protein FXN80_14690 [Dickeya fangzhongdai]|uniref:hypothetical protein n=1 Tax=Dickeya fangzhongdai TaxID=1778540 RepID=UPI00136BCEB2|nr:hypothetical protein [Dickeya fangzhongdai]UMB75361.1 hypothetical protein FXN80_14690 [Dickeya fangzhongdai]